MKIISHRQILESVTFEQFFEYNDDPSGGFCFPCNEEGEIDLESMNPAARNNLAECLFSKDVTWKGVQRFEHRYSEPAIGLCPCGAEVCLSGFTNTCYHCERDFNMSGQELAPRSQWGEETGESVADILGADSDWGESYYEADY